MSKFGLSSRTPRQYDAQTISEILRLVDYELKRLTTYAGEVTWDPGSIANAASATTTASVPGAVAGARASVRVFPPYTLSGMTADGYVSADDTVTIVLSNLTGGAVDLGSGLWGVSVETFGT